MHGVYILVKCCFCPGSFRVESESYRGTYMYHVENTFFCPHCHTRIVGIRGERAGRSLEVIPTSEEMEEEFKTQKSKEIELNFRLYCDLQSNRAGSMAGTKGNTSMPKITDFLNTSQSKERLTIALEVVKEFKANESPEEWLAIPFGAWAKLEQLEEFLEHLVNGQPLREDTIRYRQD